MRLGKTYEQKLWDRARKDVMKEGLWFAWYPVRENYGRWVWLEYIYRDYGFYINDIYSDNSPHSVCKHYDKPIYKFLETPNKGE